MEAAQTEKDGLKTEAEARKNDRAERSINVRSEATQGMHDVHFAQRITKSYWASLPVDADGLVPNDEEGNDSVKISQVSLMITKRTIENEDERLERDDTAATDKKMRVRIPNLSWKRRWSYSRRCVSAVSILQKRFNAKKIET